MIFRSILNEKTAALSVEFDRFFKDAFKNQTHLGDLLLIDVNGFYNEEAFTWDNIDKSISPYMIGPNSEGHSEVLHHNFIGKYLEKSTSDQPYDDYKKLHDWSEKRVVEINKLAEIEADSIQYEMLVYLKIWEMDLFIKKLYQLTRLAMGQEYDWHFSIAESNRDQNTTGTREKIIRLKIRDILKDRYPRIYAIIKNAYKTQLRNSIGHSKYSLHGRYIHLNNCIKEDRASQIEVIPFDDWIDIVHDTLIIYNQVSGILLRIEDLYKNLAHHTEQTMEVRISNKKPNSTTEFHILKRRDGFNDWYWKANDEN